MLCAGSDKVWANLVTTYVSTYQASLFSTGANGSMRVPQRGHNCAARSEIHVLIYVGLGTGCLYFLPDDGALQRTYSATTGSACVTADCKKVRAHFGAGSTGNIRIDSV